ncbi:MAG: PP2C family protein-serine/threonine phosphatase [Planctomycetaceae bacterium]
MAKVLLVDDEPNLLRAVERTLEEEFPAVVESTTDPREAILRLQCRPYKVLVTDYQMPHMDGVALLGEARRLSPDTVRVMLTARTEVREVAAAINTGQIFRFVSKPWGEGELSAAVRDAIAFHDERQSRREERARAESERKALGAAVFDASEIQRALLPAGRIAVAGGTASCAILPCEQATGDYLDAVPLEGGRTGILLGDVSGHGLGAALFVLTARALLRSGLQAGVALAPLLERTNAFLCRDMGGERFLTLFAAIYDGGTGTLTYLNAGHVPPLLLGPAGLRELPRTSLPLGVLEEARYNAVRQERLAPGECLLAYTDGVLEARNPEGDFFGALRLKELLAGRLGASPDALLALLREAVAAFAAPRGPEDDVALLALRYGGPAASDDS